MKKIITITFIFFNVYIGSAQQQEQLYPSDLTINGILFSINSKTNVVSLILKTFGKPDKIENYLFEMENIIGKKYSYKNGLVLYLINNTLESFEIIGKSYTFTSKNIKTGNPISSLKTIFPLSYSNRKNATMILNYENCDCRFLVEYNKNIISKIRLYVP